MTPARIRQLVEKAVTSLHMDRGFTGRVPEFNVGRAHALIDVAWEMGALTKEQRASYLDTIHSLRDLEAA